MPTAWLKRNNLNKGNLLFLTENSNNELILSPEVKKEEAKLKEILINIEDKDTEAIRREIISAYINDYNIIKIIDKNLKDKAKEVRDILHDLIALEIMEETKTTIIARDFLDLKSTSVKNLIRRMDIIIRAMMEDSKLTLKEDHYKSIMHRDLDVNRICFLIFRILKKAAKDPDTAKMINMQSTTLMDQWRLATSLESIGDESKRISRFARKIKFTQKLFKGFQDLYSDIQKDYINVMEASYKDDKNLAYNIASNKRKIIEKCDKTFEKIQDPLISKIVEKLKSMETSIGEIARIIYMN